MYCVNYHSVYAVWLDYQLLSALTWLCILMEFFLPTCLSFRGMSNYVNISVNNFVHSYLFKNEWKSYQYLVRLFIYPLYYCINYPLLLEYCFSFIYCFWCSYSNGFGEFKPTLLYIIDLCLNLDLEKWFLSLYWWFFACIWPMWLFYFCATGSGLGILYILLDIHKTMPVALKYDIQGSEVKQEWIKAKQEHSGHLRFNFVARGGVLRVERTKILYQKVIECNTYLIFNLKCTFLFDLWILLNVLW